MGRADDEYMAVSRNVGIKQLIIGGENTDWKVPERAETQVIVPSWSTRHAVDRDVADGQCSLHADRHGPHVC